jgi:hypothetical protein
MSGCLPCFQQRKTNNKSHVAGLDPPSRYFAFASPKESTQRKGDPQRVEFPPQPHRPGRGRNLRRATVAPLRTADRLTPWAARLRRLALTGPITLDDRFNQKKRKWLKGNICQMGSARFHSKPPHQRAHGPYQAAAGPPSRSPRGSGTQIFIRVSGFPPSYKAHKQSTDFRTCGTGQSTVIRQHGFLGK